MNGTASDNRMVRAIKRTVLPLLLLGLLLLGACRSGDEGLCGIWEAQASYGDRAVVISYEFNEDGSGRYSMEGITADRFTYELSETGEELLITVGETTETVEYTLNKNTLELVLEGQKVIFVRAISK